MIELNDFVATLKPYPFSIKCFTPYLRWFDQHPCPNRQDNDFISALLKKDFSRLDKLEKLLIRSCEILGLSSKEFCKAFGFWDDLLTDDEEKIHDILSEPLIVVKLSKQGFDNIKKLPKSIQQQKIKIPVADFTAKRIDRKYAIEVKNIRMESSPKPIPGLPSGNTTKPDWWSRMFKNNIITKIEDKNRKAITQLTNSKQYFSCDYTMLALHTRRIGPSALMDSFDYSKDILEIKIKYPEIDYIFCVNYFGEVVVCPSFIT